MKCSSHKGLSQPGPFQCLSLFICWRSWPPLISLILLAILPGLASETGQPPTEAEIRAAFILNFAKFTEWPADVFANVDVPLTVCFLGAEDARSAFAVLSSGKTINGHKIAVLQLDSVPDARQCQILFFRKFKGDMNVGSLGVPKDARTLTIGEADNFLARGGMIRLFVEDNRMRFDINVGASTRSQIRLSSKLLALARLVVNLPQPVGD